MTFIEAVFAAAMAFSPYHADTETTEQRADRLRVVAGAVSDATARATCSGEYATDECRAIWGGSRSELARLLLAQAWHESRLAQHIYAGNCGPYECDASRLSDGTVIHQAATIWQLHKSRNVSDVQWRTLKRGGAAATKLGAWIAARRLSGARGACGTVHGAIARYALGNGCRWSGAAGRVATFQRIRL